MKMGGTKYEKNNRNNKDNINRNICRCKNVIRLIRKYKNIKIGGIKYEKSNGNSKNNINRNIYRCKNVIRLIYKT